MRDQPPADDHSNRPHDKKEPWRERRSRRERVSGIRSIGSSRWRRTSRELVDRLENNRFGRRAQHRAMTAKLVINFTIMLVRPLEKSAATLSGVYNVDARH